MAMSVNKTTELSILLTPSDAGDNNESNGIKVILAKKIGVTILVTDSDDKVDLTRVGSCSQITDYRLLEARREGGSSTTGRLP